MYCSVGGVFAADDSAITVATVIAASYKVKNISVLNSVTPYVNNLTVGHEFFT